ncbi:MAG: glutamine synthetase III [Clostridia bacterium]|nr:glutamine synthetase III [Clostridia bacterium]
MAGNLTELFGSMVFNEKVMQQRLPAAVYESLRQTIESGQQLDMSIADTVADAMKDWAVENGATHFTHWFQPLTSVTAEKHDSFLHESKNGAIIMKLSGKSLIQGEPDASSFPSGGLRATCAARGYTTWDPSSYAFIKDNTLYIPTAFCSYTGEALDYKTPLLRSMDILSLAAIRVLRLFGVDDVKRVTAMIGAEQEYFLVDKSFFDRRDDLRYTGRTLFGTPAPKGQELMDHYLGPIRPRVMNFMHQLDEELWKIGIMCKAEHNEAAPSQHELAPLYSSASMAIDQNLIMMDIMKAIARKNGMECLLHDKPYNGINGSGKHNNWSLQTDTGKNLLKPGTNPVENTQFLLILCAVAHAVDKYQDLLKMSVSSAANDNRLGAGEAPPSIVSIYVGEELQAIIDSIIKGTAYLKTTGGKMNLGILSVPQFEKDTTDRNRTSPLAFTGNKFEFRMPGASQNLAMPNVVLNTAIAEAFSEFADELESAKDLKAAMAELIKREFTAHERIFFSGDGYAKDWHREAKRRGLSILPDAPAAFGVFDQPKNVKLFTKYAVFTESEIGARKYVLYETYAGQVEIEAKTMIAMAEKQILPAVSKYTGTLSATANQKKALCGGEYCAVEEQIVKKLSSLELELSYRLDDLREELTKARAEKNMEKKARKFCSLVIPAMKSLRSVADACEEMTDASVWPLPTYGDMTLKQS